MNGIQTRQKNATHLLRMLLVPPQNLIQWGNPFEMPRYTEVKLRWQGCVKLGHHTMSLVHMLEMCRECFWEITEMQNEKEPQHYLCAAFNCHLGGGIYGIYPFSITTK